MKQTTSKRARDAKKQSDERKLDLRRETIKYLRVASGVRTGCTCNSALSPPGMTGG